MNEFLFNSSFGLKLNRDQLVKAIADFIDAEPTKKYKVIIGTDSERRPNNMADFVTAIVIHRIGSGGRYFWRHFGVDKLFTLRDRIVREVLMSLDLGKELLTVLKNSNVKNFDFEIHVDVGEKGETKVMIQELVGMIRANNFEAKTKPDSYAASKVADRHV